MIGIGQRDADAGLMVTASTPPGATAPEFGFFTKAPPAAEEVLEKSLNCPGSALE